LAQKYRSDEPAATRAAPLTVALPGATGYRTFV